MQIPFIDADELRRLLPMVAAIDALEEVFRSGDVTAPPRQDLDLGDGAHLLLMPAWGPQGTGVKLVTLQPANPPRGLPLVNGVYVLFAPDTQQPLALLDGAELTRIRTAAVSGVATRYLSRDDARRLVVFGAGVQAEAHVEAMRAVRDITEIKIVAPDASHAEALATKVGGEVGAPEDVAEADIVCTCTTSATPVFEGKYLRPGTHVNAIGLHKPTERELDDDSITAGRIIVETKESALAGGGDIVIPLEAGILQESKIEELGQAIQSGARRTTDETTIFKSVGVAFEDLIMASAAQRAAAAFATSQRVSPVDQIALDPKENRQ